MKEEKPRGPSLSCHCIHLRTAIVIGAILSENKSVSELVLLENQEMWSVPGTQEESNLPIVLRNQPGGEGASQTPHARRG